MRLLAALLILLALNSTVAVAQSIDASGLTSFQPIESDSAGPAVGVSIGGAMSFRVAPALRVEGQALWSPSSQPSWFEHQGGHALSLSIGGRVRVKDGQRVAIDGVLQAGFVRFAQTYYFTPDEREVIGPRTHLALDFGGSLQLAPHRRFSPRFDVLSRIHTRPTQSAWETLLFNVGVTYKLQKSPPLMPPAPRGPETVSTSRRLSIGGEVSYMNSYGALGSDDRLIGAGLGGFASYRVLPGVFVDGAVTQYLSEPRARTAWDGGKPTQLLGGVKAGFTRDNVGVYIKARWGVHSAPSALIGRDRAGVPYEVHRVNNQVFDLGEVIEVRSGRRVLRFEASDLMFSYAATTIRRLGETIPQHAFDFEALHAGVGFGWMF